MGGTLRDSRPLLTRNKLPEATEASIPLFRQRQAGHLIRATGFDTLISGLAQGTSAANESEPMLTGT